MECLFACILKTQVLEMITYLDIQIISLSLNWGLVKQTRKHEIVSETCFTHSSLSWRGIVIPTGRPVAYQTFRFAPYGLGHGPKTCQIWHQWGPDFAERISQKQVGSSMELSRPVVVQRHISLPICLTWACQLIKHLSNQVPLGSNTLRNTYIWNRWMDLHNSKFHGTC